MAEKLKKDYYRFKRACYISQNKPNNNLFELSEFLNTKLLNQQTIYNIIIYYIENKIEYKTKINTYVTSIQSPSYEILRTLLEFYCTNVYSTMEIFSSIIKECLYTYGKKEIVKDGFNRLITYAEKGKLKIRDKKLIDFLVNETRWYKIIREIRTEIAHYSSIFLGRENEDYVFIIKCLRRSEKDKIFYNNESNKIPVKEILNIINELLNFICKVGNHLVDNYIKKSLDLNLEMDLPVSFNENGTFKLKKIKVNDFIEKGNYE